MEIAVNWHKDRVGKKIVFPNQPTANRPADKTAEGLIVPIIFRWPQPGVGEDDILDFLRMVDSIRKPNRTAPVANDEGYIFEIERFQKYLMIL